VKLITRLILTCGLTTLLLACDSSPETDQQAATPAVPVAPAGIAPLPVAEPVARPLPPAGNSAITLSSGNVAILANQVYELDLLNELARLANFQLLSGNIDWKTVTVDMPAQPLHAALIELLQGYPYQIVYAPDADTRQEILSEVFIGDLPATGTTDSEETDATNRTSPSEIDEPSEDSQQRAYIQQLQNPQAEIRAAAAEEIEPVGDALYLLTDMLLKDPSAEVRIAASEGLEDSEDPLAVAALVKCLQDEDPAVIVKCIESLDLLGDETTVQYLEPLLTHYDESVRIEASEAIQSLR
jgi:hypothetical protein